MLPLALDAGDPVFYLVAVAVVFGVNLLPAFGPPTWAVLVYFRVVHDLAAIPLIAGGALAAAGGRLLLAAGARRFRGRLSASRRAHLQAAEAALAGTRSRALAGLGLFAISPVPSAQLFVAAGLLTVPLVPLTAAFFAGRLVSYTLYVTAATAAASTVEGLVGDSLGSPGAVALQLLMITALVALLKVDWARLVRPPRG